MCSWNQHVRLLGIIACIRMLPNSKTVRACFMLHTPACCAADHGIACSTRTHPTREHADKLRHCILTVHCNAATFGYSSADTHHGQKKKTQHSGASLDHWRYTYPRACIGKRRPCTQHRYYESVISTRRVGRHVPGQRVFCCMLPNLISQSSSSSYQPNHTEEAPA